MNLYPGRVEKGAEDLAGQTETSFSGEMRHRVVEEFAVSYYNGSIRPNLAEKDPTTGKEIEYLMDGPQFEKIRKSDVWSSSSAVGTGYQFRVVYKDKRFSDMSRLLEAYSGVGRSSEEDSPAAEQRLYELILLMIKEGRLPKTFKLQSIKEAQNEKLASLVDELGKSLEELGRRVRKLEEQIAAQSAPEPQTNPVRQQIV